LSRRPTAAAPLLRPKRVRISWSVLRRAQLLENSEKPAKNLHKTGEPNEKRPQKNRKNREEIRKNRAQNALLVRLDRANNCNIPRENNAFAVFR
jgi:hypothetical protein